MIFESLQETYMKRCIDLAGNGMGHTAPNPMVGAVIVHDGRIIGEGFHQQFGGPHAEVHAINSVKDKSLLKKSTLYVNLEPCSHTGKTPPCADLIIKWQIPEVVVGMEDPNPLVAGSGLRKLEASGIKVFNGLLKPECTELNKRFITWHVLKRPYIILKWAQSTDGFIDVCRDNPETQKPAWISNEISRMLVHKWRSEEQSILIGTHTAYMDNPRLNVREWKGESPLRLVVDKELQLPRNLHVFDNSSPTIVFNKILNTTEGNTRYVTLDFEGNTVRDILQFLYASGIQSMLVEGGRKMIDSFIQQNLWDEARVFRGKKLFRSGVKAPALPALQTEKYFIRDDELTVCKNVPVL